jgi:hypothetical protein
MTDRMFSSVTGILNLRMTIRTASDVALLHIIFLPDPW